MSGATRLDDYGRVQCKSCRHHSLTIRVLHHRRLERHDKIEVLQAEVELNQGHAGGPMKVLREQVGLTSRQQEAIGELIQAFLEPEEE